MPPIRPVLCLAARVGRHRVDSRESAEREAVRDGDVLPVPARASRHDLGCEDSAVVPGRCCRARGGRELRSEAPVLSPRT